MIFFLIFLNLLFQSIPKFKNNFTNSYIYRLNIIGIIIASALIINTINVKAIGSGIVIYSGFLQISFSLQVIELFLLIIGSIILIPLINSSINSVHANINIKDNSSAQNYYPLIILFNLLGASCLLNSFDLLFTYISIELQSFSLYILSTLNKNSVNSTSAGLKYFLIGGFASSIILLGISLIYSSTGNTNFESLAMINISNFMPLSFVETINNFFHLPSSVSGHELESFPFLNTVAAGAIGGFIFLILGLLIKLGSAPFHQWAPEVYDKVPTRVTIWVVLIPKLSLFVLLFELILILSDGLNAIPSTTLSTITEVQSLFSTVSNLPYTISAQVGGEDYSSLYKNIDIIKNFIILSSLASLVIGSILGLSQVRIKRLLAFSAISHIGFLLLSLSIITELSIESFYFYLIQYTLTNLNVFLILLTLGNILNSNKTASVQATQVQSDDLNYLSELKGIFVKNPILSLSLAVSLFSMAGVPPLIGFFAKQQVLYAAISSEFVFLALIAISTSVISAYYYLNIVKISHFDEAIVGTTETNKEVVGALANPLNNSTISVTTAKGSNLVSLIISILTLSLLFFIIKPSLLLNSTHIIALNLFLGN